MKRLERFGKGYLMNIHFIKKMCFLSYFLFLFIGAVHSQGISDPGENTGIDGDPDETEVPFDAGLPLLVIIGIGYGINKMAKIEKKSINVWMAIVRTDLQEMV